MNAEYTQRIEKYQVRLNDLLAAASLKYSDWPPTETTPIRESAGVYHFYEKHDNHIVSIYIGKGGFGGGNKWNLYERLKQHFQLSQKNALIGKASKTSGFTPQQMRDSFKASSVHLQWLTFATKYDSVTTNLEAELRGFESFAIAVLKPRYSDA